MFDHIMIDLETLSTAKDAAILSIGAVKMDLENYQIGEDFYRVIQLNSCIDANLSIDASTIEWWMTQPEEARKIFNLQPHEEFFHGGTFDLAKVRIPLPIVLQHFKRFCQKDRKYDEDLAIWGNGSTFDNVILRNAYEECGMNYPVSYRKDLCYRTIRRMFPLKQEIPLEGTQHNSLDDARRQARALIETIKCIRKVDPESPFDLAEVKS